MKLVCYLLFVACIKTSTSVHTSTHSTTGVLEPHNIEHIKIQNNTDIKDQTNTKQIETQNNPEVKEIGYDYQVDSSEEEIHGPSTQDISKLNVECQHLYKLLYPTRQQPFSYKSQNYDQYSDDNRPVFVTTPRPTRRPSYPSTSRPSSFYITAPSVANRAPAQVTSSIKYIRLEPVILQKTILNNGRTVYYWHKSLPTTVEYPQKYAQYDSPAKEAPYQGGYDIAYNPLYNYYYNPNLYAHPNVGYYYPGMQNVAADRKPVETTTELSTTTTTEESSYSLSNLIPFYGSNNWDSTTTTTELPISTSTKSSENSQDQLKFVVPVPYDDSMTRPIWNYNPYFYYQKGVYPYPYRTPYNPQFQIVRAAAMPKAEGRVNERIDELTCTNCQGRSCSNVESPTVEDSFDTNEETCDESLLRQFTCTQDKEEEQGEEEQEEEEQEKEEAEVLENYESSK